MGILFDVVLVAVALLFLYFGVRKGAVRSAIEFFGVIAAFLLAFFLSFWLSDLIFNSLIRNSMLQAVSNAIAGSTGEAAGEKVAEVFAALPGFVANMLNAEEVTPQILAAINQGAQAGATFVVDTVVGPIVIMVLRVLLIIVLFIVFSLLIKLLARVGDVFAKLPVIRQLNAMLGGLIGLLKGAVFILVALTILRLMIPMIQQPKVFTPENIADSTLFETLYEKNPVYGLFENKE